MGSGSQKSTRNCSEGGDFFKAHPIGQIENLPGQASVSGPAEAVVGPDPDLSAVVDYLHHAVTGDSLAGLGLKGCRQRSPGKTGQDKRYDY